MAFEYQAFENGHILAIRTEEVLTMDDIYDIDFLIRSYCHQIERNVHIIVDMMLTEAYPRNVLALNHEMKWIHEDKLGWVVFLSDNHYLNILLDTAMHISGHNYIMLDNFDAAMNLVSMEYEPVY